VPEKRALHLSFFPQVGGEILFHRFLGVAFWSPVFFVAIRADKLASSSKAMHRICQKPNGTIRRMTKKDPKTLRVLKKEGNLSCIAIA
jgi:hypothetical protein